MDEQCIVMDVGGRLFKTKLETLISVSGSYFGQLFSENWDHMLDSHGHLFIDRDGDTFSVVLGYLRHGKDYPLPEDDYKLSLVVYEAQFYKLPELAKAAEKARFYSQLDFAPSRSSLHSANSPPFVQSSLQRSEKTTLTKESTPAPVLSIPAIALPLSRKPTGNSKLMTRFSRKLLKKHDKEEIGPPKQFKHVAHIGWDEDGHRIIIDRSSNDQKTLKAIMQAVYEGTSAQSVVYSMVDADKDQNRSESVEIFFAGSSIQAFHGGSPLEVTPSHPQTGIYDNCCYEKARCDKPGEHSAKPMQKSPIVTDM